MIIGRATRKATSKHLPPPPLLHLHTCKHRNTGRTIDTYTDTVTAFAIYGVSRTYIEQ
jgi:hypothetical protein